MDHELGGPGAGGSQARLSPRGGTRVPGAPEFHLNFRDGRGNQVKTHPLQIPGGAVAPVVWLVGLWVFFVF